MIRYALKCDQNHEFEAWFANSSAYDSLAACGQVTCAVCGTPRVGKAMMTPGVVTGRGRENISGPQRGEDDGATMKAVRAPDQSGLAEALRKMRDYVRTHAEDVGDQFAEEARRIHYDEAPNRAIYGQATSQEARALKDEGIDFHPLPQFADEMN